MAWRRDVFEIAVSADFRATYPKYDAKRRGYLSANGRWFVFRDHRADDWWNLTHVPTGYRAAWFRLRKSALAAADALDATAVPWERISVENCKAMSRRHKKAYGAARTAIAQIRDGEA